jgi:hypothetical protein
MQFLYMGFSQQANIRHFRFQGVLPRERPTKVARSCEFSLSADMALLARYRIPIQDGPTLCLQILTSALTGAEEKAIEFAAYAVTLDDLCAFASARNAIAEAKIARRKPRAPFKPAPSSQLKWPAMK